MVNTSFSLHDNRFYISHFIYCHVGFFNDTEVKNSAKHKIEAKQNVFSLTVNKCDHPDVGTYRALIDNGIDHTDQTAQLKVGGMSSSSLVNSSYDCCLILVKPKVEAPKPANEQSCTIGQDTQISWKFSGIEKTTSHMACQWTNQYLLMKDIK